VKIFDKEGDAIAYSLKLSDQDADIKKNIRPGSWNVRLSGDKKKVYSISPWEGQFKGKFVEFSHKKGEEARPQTQPAKPPYNKPYDFMTAIMEVMDGPCAGMHIYMRLRYNFKAVIETIDEKDVEVVGYSMSVSPNSKSEPTRTLPKSSTPDHSELKKLEALTDDLSHFRLRQDEAIWGIWAWGG